MSELLPGSTIGRYNGFDLERWTKSDDLRRMATQRDAVAGIEFLNLRAKMEAERRERKIRDCMSALDEAQNFIARRKMNSAPNMDQTINQLVQSSVALASDLVPVFRNGQTITIPVSGFPTSIANAGFVFNVKEAPYSAVGNGIADDTNAIQMAADAIGLSPFGGELYFPSGQYSISTTIQLPNNCVVSGDGNEFTTIVASNSFSGQPTNTGVPGPSVCLMANVQMGQHDATGAVQSNIFIRNMAFNGNGHVVTKPSVNPGSMLFFCQVFNWGVENCRLYNGSADGIGCRGTFDNTLWPGNPLLGRVSHNIVDLNFNPGGTPATTGTFPIVVRGGGVCIIDGNITGYQNATHTNDSCDVPGSTDVVVCNNRFYNGGDGIGFNSAGDCVASSNLISGNNGFGISSFSTGGDAGGDPQVGCDNMVVVGNAIVHSGINPGIAPGKTGIRYSCPLYPAAGPDNRTRDGACSGNLIAFSSNANGPIGIHIEACAITVTGNTIDMAGLPLHGISIDCSQADGGNPSMGMPPNPGTGPGLFGVVVRGNNIGNGDGTNNSIGIAYAFAAGSTGGPTGGPGPATQCVVEGNPIGAGIGLPLTTNSDNQVNCVNRNNPGANPLAGDVTSHFGAVGSSPWTITNDLSFDVSFTFVGGTVSAVNMNGTANLLNANAVAQAVGPFILPAGWTNNSSGVAVPNKLIVTYTGTITYKAVQL